MARPSKNYSPREVKKGNQFETIIYEDSTEYDCQLILNRLSSFWETWYYVRHDNDVYTEEDLDEYIEEHDGQEPEWKVGQKKKNHYHVYGVQKSAIQLGRAATKFGVPSNMVRPIKNLKGAVRYLIHKDHSQKYQYMPEEVITNNESWQKYLKDKKENEEKARELLEVVFDEKCMTMTQLAKFAIENGCWDELRRGQHIFSCILNERRMKKNEK